MAESPANMNEQDEPKKISFRFCRECSNLLYPVDDKENNVLEFTCRSCMYSEPATSSCIFRNDLGSNTVGETTGMTKDVADDPTASLLSPVPDFCTLCGSEIFCEICGQPSDRGFWLEVEDLDMMDAEPSGLATPPQSNPSETASQQDFFDQQSAIATHSLEIYQAQLPIVGQHAANTEIKEVEKSRENADTSQKMKEDDKPLPRINKPCPKCGEQEAVFFQAQQRTAETGMKLYYVCEKCGHLWQ